MILMFSWTAVTSSLRHHQVRPVADQDEDVALGCAEADAQSAGDLITHAGVAIFDVVSLRIAGPPEFVQVARHRTGRTNHHIRRRRQFVDGTQHLALGEQTFGQLPGHLCGGVVVVIHNLVPPGCELGGQRSVLVLHRPITQRRCQGNKGFPGVRHDREASMLAAVETRHVDVDEPHVRVLEGRPGRRREVGVAGADTDHQIGLAGQRVRGRRARGPDRADRLRVVVAQRSLPCLAFRDRNPCLLSELAQRVLRTGVGHAAAGDDQRPLRRSEELYRFIDNRCLRQRAGHVPGALGEQFLRPIEGLGLHVLRQGDRDRAGLHRVGQHAHRVQQRRGQLLRAPDPVEVLRDRAEGVVHGDVARGRALQFLQHGRRHPGAEHVRRKEKDG